MLLGSLIMVGVNRDWAADVEAMRSNPLSRLIVDSTRSDIPDASAFRLASWFWLMLALATVPAIVGVYLRKHLLGLVLAGALAAVVLVTIFAQPSLNGIPGNDPRATGMAIVFFGFIGLGLLVMLHTTMRPRTGWTSRLMSE